MATGGYKLNYKQEIWQKEAMMWMKKDIFYGYSFMLIFSSYNFSYKFGKLLSYFWGNDLSVFLLLIKLFGHFNPSILRISSQCKWEFLVNAQNVVVFSVVLCGANQKLEFSLGEGFSSISMLLLAEVKYRAEISLKMAKIG